ncbi:MAG: hypothetical protein C0606_12555 [Hyphomicrobiales bacterium]|nr:MAG: hypothetical protein C0606_12555 [Hyphomicrobiales bacterium]
MMRLAMRISVLAAVAAVGVSTASAEYPIAGVTPNARPEGAPVITTVEKTAAWYENALRGVEKPYPNSLVFLDNQGNWYTPFTRPGMPGPYDIRGLHAK